MKKTFLKNFIIDLLFYLAGSVVYAIAIPMFIAPAHISPGGFTGIALIFNYLFKAPTGLALLILNTPLLIIAFKKFGINFILRTAIATVMTSVCLDVSERYVSSFKGDTILCAVFGGILIGAGLGIVLLRGATTGGVDIIAKLINIKYQHVSVGKVILFADAFVVLLSAVCYRDFSGALYSVVTIYITSVVLDSVLYGGEKGKLVYIITENSGDIIGRILKEVGRGVTKLKGQGGFTSDSKEILLCAVRRNQVPLVSAIAKEKDKNAFVIVCEAGEIRGLGFKE